MRFILVSVRKTETKMGTYTTNYNLFLPSIGEQGWGELVNGNFETIDITMSGLNTRVGTLETETDAVEERVTTLETGNFEAVNVGTLKFDSIVMPTLSYSGTFTISVNTPGSYTHLGTYTIYCTPFPISGKVSVKYSGGSGTPTLNILTTDGMTTHNLTKTQTEYTVTNAYSIICKGVTEAGPYGGGECTFTIGIPKLV